MSISELKRNAKVNLTGSWWLSIGVLIVYSIIYGAASATFIGGLILTGPLTAGVIAFFIQLSRKQSPAFETLFSGFENFSGNCVAGILVLVYTFLWTMLFFIPGIIKSYSYSMTFYILKDHPELSGNDAITASRKLMDGHKGDLFILQLSFIGWFLLSCLTCGILFFYTVPYYYATEAAFYESIKEEYSSKCVGI